MCPLHVKIKDISLLGHVSSLLACSLSLSLSLLRWGLSTLGHPQNCYVVKDWSWTPDSPVSTFQDYILMPLCLTERENFLRILSASKKTQKWEGEPVELEKRGWGEGKERYEGTQTWVSWDLNLNTVRSSLPICPLDVRLGAGSSYEIWGQFPALKIAVSSRSAWAT